VLGIAYLEDSDDIRNTPAVPLINALLGKGARVVAHDPYVRQLNGDDLLGPAELTRNLEMALKDADAAVIVTKHRQYLDLDLAWLKGTMQPRATPESRLEGRMPILIDGRNVLDAETARAAGFAYKLVGSMQQNLWPTESVDSAFLESTIQQASLLLRASGGAFYLCDPVHSQTTLAATYNLAELPWDTGLPDRACESRKAVIETFPGTGAHASGTSGTAVLGVPTIWRDSVRGVLVVARLSPSEQFAQ
jgi:hypothetical protein